jgi:hypothetical protein
MALEKFNGFTYDDATSLATDGWTLTSGTGSATVVAGAGPNGAAGLYLLAQRAVTAALNTHSTHTVGFNLLLTGTQFTTGSGIMQFTSLGNTQVTVSLEANGKLSFYRGLRTSSGGTLLGTTTYAWTPGQQAHIQMKLVCASGTGGSIEVRVNNSSTPDLLLTGIDTKGYASNATVDGFVFGVNHVSNSTNYITVANFWATDGSGSSPYNGFLGECRVNAYLPTGAGATTGLTPSTGANWQCVDDTVLSATDYVSGTTGKDTYDFPNLGFTPVTLYAFAVKPTAKKSDAGTRSIAGVVRYSGTDTSDTAQAMSQTDTTHNFIRTTHPDGTSGALSGLSGATAEAMFNGCEFGMEIS